MKGDKSGFTLLTININITIHYEHYMSHTNTYSDGRFY